MTRRPAEGRARGPHGPERIRKRRSILANGLTILAAGLGFLLFYKPLHSTEKDSRVDLVLDVVGLVTILAGQYLRISARGHKSEKHLERVALVTDGPFALIRNPMYLGSFLIGLGIVLMILKPWMVPVYGLLFAAWYWPQIHREQKWLTEKFGGEYSEYRRRTPCIVPRLWGLRGIKRKGHLPFRLSWIKKEWNTLLVWSAVVLGVEANEDLRAYGAAASIAELAILLLVGGLFAASIFLARAPSPVAEPSKRPDSAP